MANAAEQVTTQGGIGPRISADGTVLYYRRGATIYETPVSGGSERQVVQNVTGASTAFDVHGRELFHLARADSSHPLALELRAIDLPIGRTRSISRFEADTALGLTISPDGRTALLGVINAGADLVLIENFR